MPRGKTVEAFETHSASPIKVRLDRMEYICNMPVLFAMESLGEMSNVFLVKSFVSDLSRLSKWGVRRKYVLPRLLPFLNVQGMLLQRRLGFNPPYGQ